MTRLSSLAPTRAILSSSTTRTTTTTTTALSRWPSPTTSATQVRHATFVPRPRRPYTFTQLITLSDGSSYTTRTTSPLPIYRAAKDTRNTLLWQPSEKSLKNVELDEAGKLAAFRERFGRAYDAAADVEGVEGAEGTEGDAGVADDGGYADLITGYAVDQASSMQDSGPKKAAKKRK